MRARVEANMISWNAVIIDIFYIFAYNKNVKKVKNAKCNLYLRKDAHYGSS